MKAKQRFSALIFVLVTSSLIVNACALQHRADPLLQITAPHDGDVVPLHQQVTVRAAVSNFSIYSPIHWDFYEYTIKDGDQIIAHVGRESLQQRNVWVVENNPAPGAHFVKMSGRGGRANPSNASTPSNPPFLFSDWYDSNEVCFWVGPEAPSDFCTIRTIGNPIVVAPSATAIPPTPIPVIDSVRANPSPVYYGASCSDSTVTFRAALTLPAGVTADLTEVRAHVRVVIGSLQTDSGSMLVPLQATQTWDAATGGQIFTGTFSLAQAANDGTNHFDPAALGGSSGALLWYADASSHDPSGMNYLSLGRSGNQVVDLAPCPPVGQERHHNSNSGSSSNPNSDNGGTGCEQYGNQTSCDLAGCSWNPQASSCSVNP